jgi:hypothetical protein
MRRASAGVARPIVKTIADGVDPQPASSGVKPATS